MVAKDAVKQVVDSLPDDATLDDVIHALYVRAKFERGCDQIANGRGVSHGQATERLQKWVR